MPYCSHCGVEVDPKATSCPLCRAPIQALPRDPGGMPEYAQVDYKEEHVQLPAEYRRRFALYLLSLVFFTPLLVVLIIDLVQNGALDWSLYAAAALLTAWAYAVIPLLLLGRVVAIVFFYVTVSAGFLWVVDNLHGSPWWFYSVGLPILVVLAVVCSVVVAASLKVKRKGANVGAFVLAGIVVFCVGVDVVITMNLSGAGVPAFGWSAIVAGALLPPAGFLLYVQYGIARRIDLRRRFHV
ncbi:MAG: hypothetical protein ABR590_02330 [Spirochaetia bacterium]